MSREPSLNEELFGPSQRGSDQQGGLSSGRVLHLAAIDSDNSRQFVTCVRASRVSDCLH